MVVTAAKGTHVALGNQLTKDFTGPGNFIYWFLAIGIIGALTYLPKGERIAKPFLALVITAMLLSNRGFFAKFMEAVKSGPIAPPREQSAAGPQTANAGNPDLANVASTTKDVAQITGDVAKLAVFLA